MAHEHAQKLPAAAKKHYSKRLFKVVLPIEKCSAKDLFVRNYLEASYKTKKKSFYPLLLILASGAKETMWQAKPSKRGILLAAMAAPTTARD